MPFSSSSLTSVASEYRGRRLRELLLRTELLHVELLPLRQRRQHTRHAVLVAVGRLLRGLARRLHGLAVGGEPARELRHRALHAERVVGRLDVDRRLVGRGGRHLRGHEPVPDEPVERVLIRRQIRAHLLRIVRHRRRPDRFVRVLCSRLRLEEVRLRRNVLRPERRPDVLPDLVERLLGDARRIGSHVGDEADQPLARQLDPLVELLRQHHRLLDRKPCRLLQLARNERRRRVPLPLLRRDRIDDERGALEIGEHRLRFRVGTDLGGLVALLVQLRLELRRLVARQPGEQVPVLLRDELLDVLLAVADQLQRHRLHPAGAQPPPHLVPEQRAHLVADQPVEHAPGTLRVDHLLVDGPRMVERLEHRLLGDLVEHQALDLLLLLALPAAQLLGDVPANRLTLAVRVGRDVDGRRVLRSFLQRLDDLLPGRDRLVVLDEPLVDVHAELALRQVPDVPHRRDHLVVAPQIFVDRLRLRRRLDHDK